MSIVLYRVVAGTHGDARVEVESKQLGPPEIRAMIVQKLKADAETKLGEAVTVTVEICDDGCGFEMKARRRDVLGLASMEVRALVVGGTLRVTSAPGHGTAVVLTCPRIRRVPLSAAWRGGRWPVSPSD